MTPNRIDGRRGRRLRAALAAVLVLAASWAAADAADAPADVEMCVTLAGALFRTPDGGGEGRPCDLRLDLAGCGGTWAGEVWGYAHDYSRADHEGTVEVADRGGGFRLTVRMTIDNDHWVAGGPAAYTVDLKRSGDELAGSFTGTFRGRQVKGAAAGRTGPPWPVPVKGHKPLRPGEHPRLIFRRGDIPVLRKRMNTPEGRKVVEELKADLELDKTGFGYGWCRRPPTQAHEGGHGNWAAAHAFLYVLTGDEAEARRARELVALAMQKVATGQDETWVHTWPPAGSALAYDLCYGAWEADFRRSVAGWLDRVAFTWTDEPRDYRPQDSTSAIRDFSPHGPELVMFRSVAARCAMAILGDPVDFAGADAGTYAPTHEQRWVPFAAGIPLRPACRFPRPDVSRIEPPRRLKIGPGVPTVPFANDRPIVRWITASVPESPDWRPFDPKWDRDPLASIGGARAQPGVGTEVTYLAKTRRFGVLDPKRVFADAYTDGRQAIDLLRPEHLEGQTLELFYTVLDNDAPRWVKLYLGPRYLWWPKVWFAGVPVREGEVVHLAAGKVPILMQVRLPTQQTYSPYHPAFYGRAGDKAGSRVVRRGRRGNWHYNWAILRDVPTRPLPKADMWISPRLVEVGDPKAAWQAAHEGWKASGGASPTARRSYTIGLRTVRRYLEGYLGRRGWLTGNYDHDEVNEYLYELAHNCRVAMGHELAAGPGEGIGWTALLTILDGHSRWDNDRGPGLNWLPVGFSSVPAKYRPAVSWYIDRQGFHEKIPHIHAYHLANQPWAVQPRHPRELLPRALADEKLGGFCFRSGWDDDDCWAIFQAAPLPKRNCALAGDFAVYGFGTAWVPRSDSAGGGICYFVPPGAANTVTMADTYPAAGGRVVRSALGDDGSGTAAVDMSQVFRGGQPRAVDTSSPVAWGIDWPDGGGPRDVGIRAVRCFAADYGATSGAKALYVIVDRFTGAGAREKTWRAAIDAKQLLSPAETVTTTDSRGRPTPSYVAWTNTVLLGTGAGRAGATMQITFVAPADVRARLAAGRARDGAAGISAVSAVTRGEGFFVVITCQRGDPPGVKIDGEGLAARVAIGRRTIRFDGRTPAIVLDK